MKIIIITLTINPAIDHLFFIDKLKKNSTNRIRKSYETLGGKGIHVSINLAEMSINTKALGIVLGKTGKQIKEMLKNYNYIEEKFVCYSSGESRTNYAIIEEAEHTSTLITEKGNTISSEICRELLDLIKENTNTGDYLVLSGDASNTEIPNIYEIIMKSVENLNLKIFLDASAEYLREGIKSKPFLIKPNIDELSQLVKRPVQNDGDVLKAIEELAIYGVNVIVVSQGSEGSIAKYGEDIYKVYPLDIKPVNTIGCGDAYLSGMIYGFLQELPFVEILRLATAISAAAAECELTAGFDYKRAMLLKNKVSIKKIN